MTNNAWPKGAAVLVLHEDGTILSVSRPGGSPLICMPGGKREPGESAAENACRELKEETGLTASIHQLTDLYQGPCLGNPTYGVDCFLLRYEASMGAPMQQEDGIFVRWVLPVELIEKGAFKEFNKEALRLAHLDFRKG